jgi:hypothetical protein
VKHHWFLYRVIFSVKTTPARFVRVFYPFYHVFYARANFSQKLIIVFFQLSDLFFLFDIYEISTNLIKKSTGTLTNEEILTGKSIFKNKIDWNVVMHDKNAWSAKPRICLAYVSFNTINSRQNLPDDILIHELTHVWQYQNFGAGYIVNALAAQKSLERYNYAYYTDWSDTPEFLHFNAEQQADLVQDYFLLKQGKSAQWLAQEEKNQDKLSSFLSQFGV